MTRLALLALAAFIVAGADAPSSSLDPLGLLRDYGLPIAVVMLLIFEVLVPKGRLKDAIEQRNEAIAIGKVQTEATKLQAEATNRLADAVEKLVDRK